MREAEFLIAPRDPEESIRAQAEAEVDDRETRRQSADRFLDLVQGLDVIVWEMDAVTKQFTFVSDRAQDILGYPISQWFEEPHFWQDRLLHPEDRDRGINLSVTVTNQARDHDCQYRAIAADGRVVWLKNLVRLACDSKGRPKFLRGVMIDITTDITERKQVEEARDSEALLRSADRASAEAEAARAELQHIFMQAPAAIHISRGPNHVTETANSLYIKLVGKRDLLGKPLREAFAELEGQGFFELLDQVYATGKPFIGKEKRAVFDRNRDGKPEESFWNFVYQPLVDADSQVSGIMTHAVEVTEQVRARQEIEKKAEELTHLMQSLERSNQELDQFAYVASHDLKAPLRAIANLAEWIEEDLADQLPDESREHMNLLRGRVHRMVALIDGILQYSRAGRKQQVEIVNVSALVSEVIELLTPPPEVLIVVEPGMPIFKGEKIPLEQVFMNLIGNAIKYAHCPDARVWISVRDVGKYYEFAIADNGPGIAPQYHEKIWSIFQRLEARDKVEGTGIGLSVVKKIVESRGGRVSVESEIGAGATFRFTWPKHSQTRFKS